jgi:imidazolonepropionase-like amidohydrolase
MKRFDLGAVSRFVCAASIILFSVASLQAADPALADLVLTGATVYPSPEAAAIPDASIVVHGGHIVAVGPRASVRIPKGAEILDCAGKFVVAGFWNSHVHILTPVLLHGRDSSVKDLNDELDRIFNRWGFTTVFDIASVLDNTLALRGRIDSGELRGPRILTVGEPIWTREPIYVRDFLNANHISIPRTETPEQAVALVRDHAAKGGNGIKLFTGSLQAGGKIEPLPLPVARAAVIEARRHSLPVFTHPQNPEGVNIAIESGVDILAHTVPDSPPWDAAFVARLKKANLALIPTLTLFDVEARKGDASDQERDAWIAKMVAELRAYSRAGGEILFGTDIGYIDHYDTAEEFTLMSRAGMTFPQILASLTTNPAHRFGYGDRTGSVVAGLDADLVVLTEDPAKGAAAFSKVQLTIRHGKVTYSAGN